MLDLSQFPNALARERFQKWRGRRPTLIVIDYAAAHTEELAGNAIAQLYASTMGARRDDVPLRFLLLERNADEKQGWYKTLLAAARDRRQALFPNPPLQLAELDTQLAAEMPHTCLPLALKLSRVYREACASAGIDPDPEVVRQIGILITIQGGAPAESRRARIGRPTIAPASKSPAPALAAIWRVRYSPACLASIRPPAAQRSVPRSTPRPPAARSWSSPCR